MTEIPLETRKKMGLNTAKTHFENNLIPMLERAYTQGVTEFRLCVNDLHHFYVHPSGKDGETINIDWKPADSFCEEIDINQ
jgi:hypothetical protein